MSKRFIVQGVNDFDLSIGEKQSYNIIDNKTEAEKYCDDLNEKCF